MSRNLIVIPCKNEAGNIPNLIDDFLSYSDSEAELWLVEGGSSDDSARVCSEYAERFASINFINQMGRGKFGGVRTVINHLTFRNIVAVRISSDIVFSAYLIVLNEGS